MLVLLLACSPVTVQPRDTAKSPQDDSGTAPPTEPVEDVPGTVDSDPHDSTTDSDTDTGTKVPEKPEPELLCQLALTCGSAIPDDPPITCGFLVTTGEGEVEYDAAVEIEVRGRSSSGFPKPQYAIELHDAKGDENATSLLGMGKESDWVVNGAWIDRSFFRNKLLYELFQSLGDVDRYAAESRFCELTLDGSYQGVYLLAERIKKDDDRLALADDDGTGSTFIVKQDDGGGIQNVAIANGAWKLVYPKEQEITPKQTVGIQAALTAWIDAVHGTGSIWDVVDMGSAVDFVLLEELAKNNDAYYLSMHVWRDSGGLLHFTPWDFDLSFGQPYYNNSHPPEDWILYRPELVAAMAADPVFQKALAARWAELRKKQFADASIQARIDDYATTLGDAPARNWKRWDIDSVEFAGPLYPVKDWPDEVGQVRLWIEARLSWMDENVGTYEDTP